MVFPQHDDIARHPSQLYQLLMEGVLLFVILWLYTRRPRPAGTPSSLFLIGYGTLRFIAEFAREPDEFLGFLAWHLSMGQWLSLPMIAIGLVMMMVCLKRAARDPPQRVAPG
jgi:phosphatidylglycerol:prolipoprotein diacylglycerol transferase